MKYYLYARKSTDEEDRQVLSIEAQLTELKEFAAKEKLEIVASFQEAKTAKEPGRTTFGQMLNSIEKGEADGIIAWHPDRLARNSVDGGRIIHLVDRGLLKAMKFPTFWFEPTPQGLFMLNIAFGQSKYFVDNLRENVKRGFRQKLRRGEWPGWAPPGYTNDRINKVILVDKKTSKLVHKLFELYSTSEYSLYDLSQTMNGLGLRNRSGQPLAGSTIEKMLRNPFYVGLLRWNGELYPAKHEPIISKKLFDECQAVIERRGRPHTKHKQPFSFTGLIKCGSCGGYITAERQKGYVYYRCTKKKGVCDQKYIREETLVGELQNLITSHALPSGWPDKMLKQLEIEKAEEEKKAADILASLKSGAKAIDEKLDKLLDAHLEGVLARDEYVAKKDRLLSEKLKLDQRIAEITRVGLDWLEPMKEFLIRNKQAKSVACRGDHSELRSFVKNIGSNFFLKGETVGCVAKIGWSTARDFRSFSNWYRRSESNRQARLGTTF